MNLFDARIDNNAIVIDTFRFPISPERLPQKPPADASFKLGIRPEFVGVSDSESTDAMECEVRFVEDTGAYKILDLHAGSLQFRARVPESAAVVEGARVWAAFAPEHLKVFAE